MLVRRDIIFGGLGLGLMAVKADAQANTYFEGPSSQTLPLQRGGDGKLFLTVQVMGRDLALAIDTGGATMLDTTVADGLKLDLTDVANSGYALGGNAVQHKAARVDMALGKLKIRGLPILCLDLGQPRELSRVRGWPVYDGLIGPELLTAVRAIMDFGKPALTVKCPG